MASSKKVGFFWGEDKITVIETEKNTLLQIFSITRPGATGESPFSTDFSEDIQTVAVLQKALRDQHIQVTEAHVSFPIKDVILRSFVVPLVKPNELQQVVDFELKKYVPFDPKELVYVFHPLHFVDNKVKKIKIFLFAIRKDTLDRYERIFRQVGLTITLGEPAAMSLIKGLVFKKEIHPQDRIAFLHVENSWGRIYFMEGGVPQFIREFQLEAAASGIADANPDPQAVQNRLFNEVRNSFDFYVRQFNKEKLSQLLVFAPHNTIDWGSVSQDLGLPIKNFIPSVTAGASLISDIGAVFAVGVSVDAPADLPAFNFLDKKKDALKSTRKPLMDAQEAAVVLKVAVMCVTVVLGAFYLAHQKISEWQKQTNAVSAKQGPFANTPVKDIEAKIKQYNEKILVYKDIRTKSDMAPIMVLIPKLLPQGMWLKSFNIQYQEIPKAKQNAANNKTKIKQPKDTSYTMRIELSGAVYTADPNQQIRLVNDFVLSLKKNPELAKYIKQVDLSSMQREEIRSSQRDSRNLQVPAEENQIKRTSVSFTIKCS